MKQCEQYSTSAQARCCYVEGHSGEHHFSNVDETDRIRWKLAADQRDSLAAELAEAREEAEQWQASAQAVVNLFDPAGHQASPGTLRLTCEAAKDANRALRVDRASLEAERDAAIRERDAILAASQRSVARISPEDVEALRWGHAELTDSEFVTSRMSQRFITVLSRLIASSGGSK